MEKVEKILIGLFFLLLLVAIFGWQSEMELRGEEPRRAVITFEMIFNDNYWRPTLNGWDYYNKPRYLGKTVAWLTIISFLTLDDLLFSATVTSGEMDLFLMVIVVLQLASIWVGILEKNKYLPFIGSFLFCSSGNTDQST